MSEEQVAEQVAQESKVSELASQVQSDFKSMLSDEYRNSPVFEKMNDINDLAKEHVNLQGLIGRKGIIRPNENDPEDIKRFNRELGVPEKWEDYATPELDIPKELMPFFQEDKIIKAKQMMYDAGIPKSAAEKIMSQYISEEVNEFKEMYVRDTQAKEAAQKELKERFGMAYDQKIEIANEFAQKIGQTENEQDFINKNLNDPAFISLLTRMGDLVSPDTLATGGQPSIASPERLQAELDELMKPDGPYLDTFDKHSPEQRKRAKDRVKYLYSKLGK